ncbi:MAG: T9SS type A sorting domain-containing protein [Bacteroidales bacterium]|nr:T9SS type A sorting domain-containing protein [Bacteroidales bacterium]
MKNLYHCLTNCLICLLILTLSSLNGYTQITVQTPNGGEVWLIGASHDILWTPGGTSGNVRLEYSANGGTDWFEIVTSIPDGGSYSWSVPSNPSTDCIVRISDVDGDPVDVSDAAFVILPETLAGEYVTDANTIGLWHLNETSGTSAYDFSGNGNNGSIIGTTVGSGQFGSAREFYTASDQISVTNDESLNFGTGSYTIEFWVKAPPNSGGHPMHKRGNTTLGTTGRGWFTNIENNKIAISLYNDPTLDGEAGNCGIMSIRDVADDTWHHVAFVNTYESILCYIDGFLDSQAPIPWQGSPDNDGILDIGVNSHTGEFLGALDEIRISNKARTPDEFSVNPGIRINAPNGGEFWQGGNEYLISWNSFGTSGNVTLEFSRNNGIGWATIEAGITDNGNYSWDVPNEPCTECLIRVADTDGDPVDVSDGVFTVLDQFAPSAGYPHASSYHDRFRDGHEQYGIELSVMAQDPQGPGDISSVKVTLPDNSVWDLFDDGQHADGAPGDGNYGLNILTGAEPPALGDYIFTVADGSANTATATDALQQIISIPGNMTPANGAFMTVSEHPTFTWDAVPDVNNYYIDVMDVNGNNLWNYGDITTNSIEYNLNGAGQALTDGSIYQWQLQAFGNDGRSWQEPITFTYSSSTANPVAYNAYAGSMHSINFNGNENYALELYVNASDPQGPDNIASVTATSPTGAVYTLFDNGQNGDDPANNGRFGVHIWNFSDAPPLGTYTFTVTDIDDNTAVTSDVLQRVIDVPRNTLPLNNAVVNTSTPTFSWDGVSEASYYWIGVHDMQHNNVWSQNDINGTSIVYNDNLSGLPLIEGQMYQWQVSTQVDDGRSWHEWTTFIYSDNTTDPFVSDPGVYSMHHGDDCGNEGYGLELFVNAADPQGSGNISSVTVTSPTGAIYSLFDNGQNGDDEANNGRYGVHIWEFNQTPPPLGTYTFTVTDVEGHTTSVSDVLDNVIDYPRNLNPANNTIISDGNITFTWQAVSGVTDYGVSIRDNTNNQIWSGNTATNSIEYSGPAFIDGNTYNWNVGTSTVIDARSWHDGATFIYSSDPDKPLISYTQVYTVHDRFTNGTEQYRLELNADVADPQGIADITSVTVTAPGGEIYTLYNDGMHGDGNAGDNRFSNYDLPMTVAPAIGDYTFTATDGSAHTATVMDPLQSIPAVPENMSPLHGGIVNSPNPIYTWDAVQGATSYAIDVQDIQGNNVWNRNDLSTNSVEHNYDGIGSDLSPNHGYRWQLQAYTEEGRSWQEWLTFTYSTDGISPVAENPSVQSRHWGRDQVYENYGLELRLNVMDPQGLENIASVTVAAPGGAVFELYDDGQHADNGAGDGYFGNNIWNLTEAPVTGEYVFTVTDEQTNTAAMNDILDHVIDIPRNIQPAQNSFVTTATPTLSWNEVPGATSYWIDVNDGNTSVWSRGDITGTSIVYNDNATGQALQEGRTYYLNVNAGYDDAISWHDNVTFTYSTDLVTPIASQPGVRSMHRGDDQGNEGWALELYVIAGDPQGPGNIQTVTATSPDNVTYTLYDDGMNGDPQANDGSYGIHIWSFNEAPPPLGEYVFTVTDNDLHAATARDNLDLIIDYPRNIQPVNNSVINSPTPVLSWDAVPGVSNYWVTVFDANNNNIWNQEVTGGTSVQYSGPELQQEVTYHWQVDASLDDSRSWHDWSSFAWSSDPYKPFIGNSGLWYRHYGDDEGTDQYYIELMARVNDPQGLDDIQSVTLTTPNLEVITLSRNDGDPGAWNGQWSSNQPPALGDYTYTVTDLAELTDTQIHALAQAQDFPRNVQPANNEFVSTATPTFSWDPVEGITGYHVTVYDINYNQLWNQDIPVGVTSVVYNNDGTGQLLTEGSKYRWEISTWGDHCATWHNMISFTYSTNTENPLFTYANVFSMYHGNNAGSEHAGIRLMADVNDPQGLSDIQSVTVTSPDFVTYTLYDDGQHGDDGPGDGRYGDYVWDLPQAPAVGIYSFNVTDNSVNSSISTDILDYAIDYPRTIIPENNGILTPVSPVFSWNPVEHAESYFIYVYESNGWDIVWTKNGITDTSVLYNDDATGIPLTEGSIYTWEVFVDAYDGHSWHELSTFAYRSNTDRTIHVNIGNTSGIEDGSESHAYNTIQEAIDASIGGDVILVWPGTYSENLNINNKNIILNSLFANSGDENDVLNTIIDGNLNGTVLVVQSSDLTIHGFTIQNGQAPSFGAGGIQFENCGYCIVSNCIIKHNNGIGQDEWGAGGIISEGGNLSLYNCIITENYTSGGAAGIRASNGEINVVNTLIGNNAGNLALHYDNVSGNIMNTTIVNNSRAFGFNNSPVIIFNSIEWNNNSDSWGNPGSVRYSCTQVPMFGTGVIHTNPVFMNINMGDYHLQVNSPCIDSGDPDFAYNDPDGTRNDMGHYGSATGSSYTYLDGPPVLNYVNVNPAYVTSGQQLTITASLLDAQTLVSSVTADIESPDETVIASVLLYDDGAHSDNGAGDGIFGNSVADNWTSGQHYFVDLVASDDNSNVLSVNSASGFDGIISPDNVNLPFTHEVMNVNGLDDEPVWNSIAAVPVTKHLWGPIDNAGDLSASFKACWNLDSLFVLINVVDDSLDNIHGTQGWDNDKISLYLDMDNSRGSFYDQNDWDMTVIWEGGFNPNRNFSGFRYVHQTNANHDGYQLEMALSLKDLGYPLAETLGFDIDIMDRDGEDPATALLFWNSEINLNYTNPGLNGIATLLDYDANMPDQALKVVDLVDFAECATGAAEVKVLITNFGILPVEQFDIMYSLNGDTIDPVETVNMIINPGDTVEYTFTTPAVLTVTGRYSFNIATLLNSGDPHANFALTTERFVFGTDAYERWTTYSTCNGLPDNSTRFVMEDSQGNIWAGTSNGGAAKLDHDTGLWEVFNSDNSGFSNNNAITVFEDSYGIIWIGLDGEDGIVRSFDGTNWTSNNLGNVHVLTMFEDHAGNMWFGTWGSSGLRKWERSTDTWTTYNNQNSGLPSHDMWYGAIMEDGENNMWFGTISGGLVKFDGTNWTVFNTSTSGIPNDLVLGSLMDHNGDIWLAHGWSNQGVSRFNGSYFQVYNTGNSGLTSDVISNIFEDHNGNLWFGSWGNGVSKFNGTTWQNFTMENSGLTSNSVNSITEDANGDIWFSTSYGLCKYDAPDQAIKVVDVVDFPVCGTADAAITVRLLNTGTVNIDQFDITYSINGTSIDPVETVAVTLIPGDTVSFTFSTLADLSAMGNYTLYVTSLLNGGDPLANESLETQYFVFGSDTWEDWISYNQCNGMPAGNVRYVLEDSQGNIWAALNGTGVARLDNLSGTWTLYNSDNSGFDNNSSSALCEDHLGNIWVGLDGTAAVVMFDGTSWTSNNPENIHVLSIMEDHAGNMWFGTWGYGVRKWDRASDTWTAYTTANSGLPSNDMWYGAIMEDSENNMWFATLGGGLAKFDGTIWTVYNSGNSSIPNNTYWGSLLDSQGNIWLAHGWAMNDNNVNGVTRFDGTTFTTYNTGNSGIASDKIFNIFEDSEGSLWFGSWGQGVSRFDGTSWENFTMDNSGLTSNSINSIGQDHEGNMWFGTGRGIDEYVMGTVPPETHFVPVWTGNGQDHMNFYATSATIEGIPMQPGDEIGIFDGDACVGTGVLTLVIDDINYFEIRVSRDEPTTPEKDGYTAGNTASFRLWDDSEQREIANCNVTYTSGTNVFDIGATTWYEINGYLTVNQEISLTNGWNVFSLFVTPDDTSMMGILQPLINEGSLMKVQNESGAAIEQMPGGAWLDNIHYWRRTEGYKIRVNASTTLSVTGRPLSQPVNIGLLGGWNIMGYPSSTPQVAMTALDELITSENLLKVQSETGAAIEPMPMNMGWIDNIHNLEPGEGYKIRVSIADVLTITPSDITGGLKSASAELQPQHFQPNWTGNGYDHMNIYLTEMSEVSNLKPGDEISVYDGDVCVGVAVIGNRSEKFVSVAVSADDPATTEIDGFVKGNSMSFRIWRTADNSETHVNSVYFYAGYTDVFEPMGTTVAGVSIPANGMSELVTSFGDNYPNPFVLETTFNFTLGETLPVNITLYNLLGEKVKILVSQTMEGGSYTSVWDATDHRSNRVPPGIYICRMIAGDYVAVKTVELTQ